MICCDGCVRSFHENCHYPRIDTSRPDDEWYCYLCTNPKGDKESDEDNDATKDEGRELSHYEQLRLKNIKRNENLLVSLGLLPEKQPSCSSKNVQPSSTSDDESDYEFIEEEEEEDKEEDKEEEYTDVDDKNKDNIRDAENDETTENLVEVWDVDENDVINVNLNEEEVKIAEEDVEIYEEGNSSSLMTAETLEKNIKSMISSGQVVSLLVNIETVFLLKLYSQYLHCLCYSSH